MSLVGSLEDLGLGDILQIVSLSRKSGRLLLRSGLGDGRIAFRDGLVRAAHVKGEPEDLRGLLVPGGFVDPARLDLALETARETGLPVEQAIAEHTGLSPERLDSLRREQVERAVVCMFSWRVGEFSFEVRDEIDPRDQDLWLPIGINAQYLTIEATRLGDEGPGGRAAVPPDDQEPERGQTAEDGFILSGEAGTEEAPEATREGGEPGSGPHEVLALATAARAAPEATASGSTRPAPLVVIDPDLRALEWTKAALIRLFKRVHIFQRVDGGVARIRQYLGRSELPTVVVSSQLSPDRIAGAENLTALLRRLDGLAPQMPVLVMHDGSEALPAGVDSADAVVSRPPSAGLGDPGRQAEVQEAAEELWVALEPWSRRSGAERLPERGRRRRADPVPELHRLREISMRLRDPSTRGEVLSVVLDFAAERFRRVAMFMVREDVAVGIAQRGIGTAGGGDDSGLGELRVPVHESAWFRAALDRREPVRGAPSDPGDRELARQLGAGAPAEALVAPIESGGRVAALLYADNHPGGAPIGDTTLLAIVLHEAGLALDRALLERALAEAERAGDRPGGAPGKRV
jgi:hypothetical protein